MKNLIIRALVAKKKLFIIFVAVCMAVSGMAQTYPTKFLGIPIDGTKASMIQKLQAKGFTYDKAHDCLTGQFNGSSVHVYVVTNGNKVWRIMVADANRFSEGEIRIRFNDLLRQFRKNQKYIPLNDKDYRLSENEDISYEMTINNKRYSAEFLQITYELDSAFVYSTLVESIKSANEKTGESFSLDSLSESERQELLSPLFELARLYAFEKNKVWFLINEFYGEYYISIYYDNEYNKADGEDL